MATKKETPKKTTPKTAASSSSSPASPTNSPHPITLVRGRLARGGREAVLLRPFAELVPRLFRHSRRGARLAERLVVDRPLLSTGSALAELAGQVQDPEKQRAWAPARSPVAAGIPRILVDKLAYALHRMIDDELGDSDWSFSFGDAVVPGPVAVELRGVLAAVERLRDEIAARLHKSTLDVASRRRARVTLDEGPPPGFFFTEDTAAVPRGMLLALDDVESDKPLHFVGVRGPVADLETQAYAIERILDVITEPMFDELPRLIRLAGGRYGALLAALDELVVVDEDAPRLVWRVLNKSGGFVVQPLVRGASGQTVGPVTGSRLEDAVRALPFATPQDVEIARVAAQRERLDGLVAEKLIDHPFVELHDGRGVKVVHARAVVVVRPDRSLGFTALSRPVDAAALGEDGAAAVVDGENARVVVVVVTPQQKELARAVAQIGDAALPQRVLDDVVARLKKSKLEVNLPMGLRGRKVAPSSSLVVRVSWKTKAAGGHGGARFSVVARPLAAGPTFIPGHGPDVVFADDHGDAVWCERDRKDEDAFALRLLDDVGVEDEDVEGPFRFAFLSPDRSLRALALLAERDDVEIAFTADGPRVHSVRAPQLRVQLGKRTDWLGVDGTVALDDGTKLELLPLMEALREGRRFVVVDKDRIAALSTELIEQLGVIAAFTGKAGEAARGAVSVVDEAVRALAAAGAVVDKDAAWSAAAVDVEAARAVDGAAPAGVNATLRPYQEEGLRFLRRLSHWGTGAVLADDMGLGKTLVTTCLLVDRASMGPQLVVAPTSLCLHWQSELRRFAPALRPLVYGDVAAADRKDLVDKAGSNDVVIASYGLLQRDPSAFVGKDWVSLVVDEAQAVKNASTSRAQALRTVPARFRVALTGTPIENHTGELWSIFDLVSPGLFGTFNQWKARWASPIEKDEDDERKKVLARAIRPFLLRRKKSEVARDLPEKTVVTRVLTPTPEEKQAYERLRLALIADLEKGKKKKDTEEPLSPAERRVQILTALTRLRLCACHPVFASDVVDRGAVAIGSKQRALVELVDELRAAGHKALVFSQFVMHLTLARRFLDESGARTLMLTGETPMAERQRLVDEFQAGGADVFLISLKAGGFGLNLTRASYVVHLDPWWNPAVEEQASDRAHRIGQTLPVTVLRLVTGGTLEEPILDLHERKKSLADGVLDGTDRAGALSVDELMDLVKTSRRFDGAAGRELVVDNDE